MTTQAPGKLSIEDLAKSDPKFIERAIKNLDGTMGSLMQKKLTLAQQIDQDRSEVRRIDAELLSYRKRLEEVQLELKEKQDHKERLTHEHEDSAVRIKGTVKGAADILQQARIMSRKISKQAASERLMENRGFSTTVPTTKLIRQPGSGSGASTPAGARSTMGRGPS